MYPAVAIVWGRGVSSPKLPALLFVAFFNYVVKVLRKALFRLVRTWIFSIILKQQIFAWHHYLFDKKISKLSYHDKLINLIAVQGEKDVNHLLQSVDKVFIEVFKLKQKDLPWLSNNSEEEWDNVMRKVRLAIFKLYFEYVKKERTYH